MLEVTPAPEDLAAKLEAEKMVKTTKDGFDLSARLRNRGLRKAAITLYLDEEKGVELGWAHDTVDTFGNVTGRAREGVVGELDALIEKKKDLAPAEAKKLDLDTQIAELEARRDALLAELNKDALVIRMRAVPPVIQKDCRRKARASIGVKEKNVPDDMTEEYGLAHIAHLMSVMFQSITDTQSGETNAQTTYQDGVELIDYLPPGQFDRLNEKMGEVQYTDAISRTIEGQEDFS